MAGNSTVSNKHLVILTPGFPENEKDLNCLPSVQGFVMAMSNEIGSANLTILSFQYPFHKGWYEWNGINIYSAGGKNRRGIFRLLTFGRIKNAFYNVKDQHPEIVIHSLWLTGTAFIGQQLSKRYSYPHIASILGQDAQKNNHYLRVLKKSNIQIIANSNFIANILSAHYKPEIPVKVIPLGINPEQYILSANPWLKYDLITAGSFTEIKQYHLFIELVKELKKDFPKLKVAMAGDGPLRKNLQQQIAEEGLISTIELLGIVPNSHILEKLKQSRIFVHTSRYEASSHAILEAGYAGIPVVCFNVGFYPMENAVFPCSDLSEMKNRITLLLRNPPSKVTSQVPLINETIKEYRKIYGI